MSANNPLVPDKSRSEGLATHATRALSAFVLVSVMMAVMWGLELYDDASTGTVDKLGPTDKYGIDSRDTHTLWHIFTAPFLHAGVWHLIANTIPFLVLGFLAAVRNVAKFVTMNLFVIVVGGLGVWFTGPVGGLTLGASILIFGYFGYLLGRGVFERHLADIAIAIVVVLVYGTMIVGVLPTDPNISWQGHLFGLIGGFLAARVLRRRTTE